MWEPDSANTASSDASNDEQTGLEGSDVEPTGADAVEQRRLPPEIGENLQALFGTDDRPETVGEWVEAVAAAFDDDWPPSVPELCHDEEGLHLAETGDETYRFVCVLDAVMLPFLTEESVTVRSEGPQTGQTVVSHASRTGIETDPEDAVLSFGVAPVEPDRELTPRLTYETMCPYVHAFPDRDAYERWDERTDAPTMGLPLSGGFELARALVRA